MSISGRELAKLSGMRHAELKKLEQAGIVSRDAQRRFPLERTLQVVFRHLRERLHLAELLCRRWCPGELEARWEARGDY